MIDSGKLFDAARQARDALMQLQGAASDPNFSKFVAGFGAFAEQACRDLEDLQAQIKAQNEEIIRLRLGK